jgi:hypothetical protein
MVAPAAASNSQRGTAAAPRPRCVQLQQRRLGRRDAGRGWVGAAAAVHGTNRVKRGTFGPWKLEEIGAAFMVLLHGFNGSLADV